MTNFFREPEAWETLARDAIAALVREHDDETPIRVWTPGCATGEEPYSLAMLLCEDRAETRPAHSRSSPRTSTSTPWPSRAPGSIPEDIAADVSPERLRRFFVKGEHTYRINKDIREAVVFAEQNIVSDPPFSKLDLISCRNLLIYLESEVQEKILSLFHFALREGGYLFLGGNETVSQGDDLFKAESRKHRVYRRVSHPAYVRTELPSAGHRQPAVMVQAQGAAAERRVRRLAAVAQQVVAQRFAPACVLINRRAEVLYLNGPVDRYLQLPSGELGAELTDMARPGLRARLRTAVREAIQADRAVAVRGVRIKKNGGYFAARLLVDPLRHPPEVQGLFLVAFDEEAGDHRPRLAEIAPPEPPREETESAADYEAIIHQLEHKLTELEATNNDLNNLLASTDIATVFLDRGLCLKRFIAATKRLIRVIETDVGQPIRDFALNFTDPDLLPDAERVLQQLAAIEREVQDIEGRYYLQRILPYRTEDDRIVGAVITFNDATKGKEHERALAALAALAAELDERVRARTHGGDRGRHRGPARAKNG